MTEDAFEKRLIVVSQDTPVDKHDVSKQYMKLSKSQFNETLILVF